MLVSPNWKRRAVRSADYLAFVRSQPCCVCRTLQDVAAHHEQEKGQGAKGSKADDTRAVPLCTRCHRLRHDKGRSMWGVWGIDPEQVIARLKSEYISKGGKINE